jgi:hypothetical protein
MKGVITMTTYNVRNARFKYYQPNPKKHECGDCVVRAIAKAITYDDWQDAFDMLVMEASRQCRMPNEKEVYKTILEKHGFEYHGISNAKGTKRPKVSEFAGKHKGIAVLRLANHLVAVEDGYYWDIWDCGNKSLYGYWSLD